MLIKRIIILITLKCVMSCTRVFVYTSKIQKNWCTVTVAPTIEHQGGHLRTPANQRWDQVPGGVSVSYLASHKRHECSRHNENVYLTLDVDRHYIGSVTATTHQEKGIITLELNPLRGTVLPAPHGKGNKYNYNVSAGTVSFIVVVIRF